MRREDKPKWLSHCEWIEGEKGHWIVYMNVNGEKISLENLLNNLVTFRIKK